MTKIFQASLDELRDMLLYIRESARRAHIDEPTIVKIELAAEEALVNIINYGYPGSVGKIEISSYSKKPNNFSVVLRDWGVPYNPLANYKNFNPHATLESCSVGGYGILFILKLMDEVQYSHEEGCNILTLTKFNGIVA